MIVVTPLDNILHAIHSCSILLGSLLYIFNGDELYSQIVGRIVTWWSNKVKKQISSHAIRMINCPLTSFCNAWPVNCPRMHILCNESLVFRWRNNRLGIIPASSGVLLCALCMDSGTVVCYIMEMTQGLHRYHLTQTRCV